MKLIRQLFFVGLGILAACLLLEGLLRITDPTDYNRFTTDGATNLVLYQPNYSFVDAQPCYANTAVTNSEGLHAPEPPAVAKTPQDFRIALVGSSFVEALQVPIADMASTLLEQKLNAQPGRQYHYQVIPIAFSGNGTYLDILYYLRYGQQLKPDLVIDLTTEYEHARDAPADTHFDASENLVTTLPPVTRSGLTYSVKNLLRNSKLIMNLFNQYLVIKNSGLLATIQSGAVDPQYQATQWSNDARLMGAFATLAKNDNAKFMVASWTSSNVGTSTAQTVRDNLAQMAHKDGFAYDDLVPSISAQEKQSGTDASWSCDAHWSPAGNAYAAQALFDYLTANRDLLTKP